MKRNMRKIPETTSHWMIASIAVKITKRKEKKETLYRLTISY